MTTLLNILMLEDSPFDAELVQRLLKKEIPEAVVQVVSNRAAFIRALEETKPKIILSDNSLPDIDAKNALIISRRMFPYIPFIMVSGTVGEESATEIIRMGADDYILKDRISRLPAAIDTAILIRERELEKQQALDLLRTNEERYRTLIGRVTDAFISCDRHFCFTFLNKKAGELIRRNPDELVGKYVWDVFPEAVGSDTYHAMNKAMEEQQYMFNVDYFEPLDLWQENHIYPGADGLSIFVRDVTQQKKAQEALRKMEEEVVEQRIQHQKNITRAMMRAQEAERNRLGREMHDNINQILTASKIYLTKGKPVPEDLRYPLELIDTAIEELRLLSSQYVTPVKDVDLEVLVRRLVLLLRNEAAVKAELIYEMGDHEPEDELKLNVYRMIQEQVNNIIKYASARQVTIIIEASGREMQIVIADDGVGFDTNAKRNGIGISNMINRIETFDGRFELISSPGKGCTVQISLPLPA